MRVLRMHLFSVSEDDDVFDEVLLPEEAAYLKNITPSSKNKVFQIDLEYQT